MKTHFFIAALLMFSAKTFSQTDAKSILMETSGFIKGKQSIQYKADFKIKFFNRSDTSNYIGKVGLFRIQKDSVFGGKIWFTTDDSIYKFYDLSKIYVVNKKKKKVMTYNPHKGEKFGMDGNVAFGIVWKDFLNPAQFVSDISEAEKISLLQDSLINEHDCYQVLVHYPDDGGITERTRWYFIDKKTKMLIMQTGISKFQGKYQYKELLISSPQFNAVNPSKFSSKQIPTDYKTEAWKAPDYTLLDSGSHAPFCIGKNYTENLKMDTVNYIGKITVLDFWYMSCMPCTKAIPQIEKLKAKYKDIQIIGVNADDNKDERIKKLPEFFKNNPIEYPIFLVENSIPTSFRVQAYPTFYIIDKEGKIRYASMGYSDNLSDELSAVIEPLLK